jgi:hypothetical protein
MSAKPPAKKDEPAAAKKPRGPESWSKGPEQRPKWMIDASLQTLDTLDVDSLALALTTDLRPLAGALGYLDWRLCGAVSRMVEAGTITGAAGEKVLMPTHGRIKATRVFVFGWGDSDKLLDGATDKLAWMKKVLDDAKAQKIAFGLPEPARQLMGLVEVHVVEPLGPRLAGIFTADPLLPQNLTYQSTLPQKADDAS